MRPAIPLLASVALAACTSLSSQTVMPNAAAVLNPTAGNTANGIVTFTQTGDQLLVDARISGLRPGLHGFHIHEKGDCSAPDATSAGGHFNPAQSLHGDPGHGPHHGGDFGNLVADANGIATLKLAMPVQQITLEKEASNSIVGRGVIVHADPDDLKTQPTGNSGKRVACGAITLK